MHLVGRANMLYMRVTCCVVLVNLKIIVTIFVACLWPTVMVRRLYRVCVCLARDMFSFRDKLV